MKKKHITPLLIAAIIGILLIAPHASAQAQNTSNLRVIDLSGAPYEFTYAQILDMPKTIVNADLYCDGVLVTHGDWGGVLLSYLLTQAKISPPEAGSIQFTASDGYQTALPINIAVNLIIAHERDGQPLAEELRLIVPDANGVVWIAKITSITLSTSGAQNPPGISIGNPKNVLEKLISPSPSPPAPTPKQTSVKPQPSTQENISGNQATPTNTPTNAAKPNEPTINSQTSNQTLNLQTLIAHLIVATLAISLTATAYITLNRKKTQKTLNTS